MKNLKDSDLTSRGVGRLRYTHPLAFPASWRTAYAERPSTPNIRNLLERLDLPPEGTQAHRVKGLVSQWSRNCPLRGLLRDQVKD